MRFQLTLIITSFLISCSNGNQRSDAEYLESSSIDTVDVHLNDTISIGAYNLLFSETDSSYVPDFLKIKT